MNLRKSRKSAFAARLIATVFCAVIAWLGLAGTANASTPGPNSHQVAAAAATPHWYMTPNPGNDCQLNVRSSASTSGHIVTHLSSCSSGAWCWNQTSDCGSTVTGGSYTCYYADGSSGLHSNKWVRVADNKGRLAYVARLCGYAQYL